MKTINIRHFDSDFSIKIECNPEAPNFDKAVREMIPYIPDWEEHLEDFDGDHLQLFLAGLAHITYRHCISVGNTELLINSLNEGKYFAFKHMKNESYFKIIEINTPNITPTDFDIDINQ